MRRALATRACAASVHGDCMTWLVLAAPPAAAAPATTPAAASPPAAAATATTTATAALGLGHAFRWDGRGVRLAALEPNLRLHVLGHAGRIVHVNSAGTSASSGSQVRR